MTTTEILNFNGFYFNFPFVDHFIKEISETKSIIINTSYFLKRNDVVEDTDTGILFFKVSKIELPKKEVKIFKCLDNALKFAIYVD